MKKKATRLRDLHLTSVDLCGQGANPDAYIRLYKSQDGPPDEEEPLEKEAQTFSDTQSTQSLHDMLWKYQDALSSSLRSILDDKEAASNAKREMMLQSLSEFSDAVTQWIGILYEAGPAEGMAGPALSLSIPAKKVQKEGETQMNPEEINTGALTPEEKTILSALLKKAAPAVAPDAGAATPPAAPVVEKTAPAAASSQTSASTSAETEAATGESTDMPEPLKKAIDHYNNLTGQLEERLKKMEEQEIHELAKKYEALGDPELEKTLQLMKSAGGPAYDAYLATLDRQLALLEKADAALLGEVGKSSHAYDAAPGSVGKAEEIAKSIQSKNPSLTWQQAMAEAFDGHPELIAEYERDYERGRS